MTRSTLPTAPFLQTSSAGTAAIISDPSSTFWANLVSYVNEHAASLDTIGAPTTGAPTETKTSGALTLTTLLSRVSVTGTVAFSLADGTTDGQIKIIECTVAASSPLGTLTVATMDTAGGGASATFQFNTVNQRLVLQWTGLAWHILSLTTAGQKAVVVGTTVLTGVVMNSELALSVTATVHSTGTKAIPNGRFPGQRLHIMTPTAASTPLGDLDIVATTIATGAAATSLAGINATSCQAQFEWDGAAWQCQSLTTATLA